MRHLKCNCTRITIYLILAIMPLVIGAQESAPEPPIGDLDTLITSYYREPNPGVIKGAIGALQVQGLPRTQSQVAPVLGFFAEVFASNPGQAAEWTAAINDTTAGLTKKTLLSAMELSKDLGQIIAVPDAQLAPAQNDVCWGAFFASGKTVYLDVLINRLQHLNERKNLTLYTTAASALWSLSSNARMHPLVRAHMVASMSDAPKPIKKAINQALEESPELIQQGMIEVVKKQHAKGIW